MDKKTDLRTRAKDIRKTLSICQISEKLTQMIQGHKAYIEAKHIMLYYPTKYEMNFLRLLKDNKEFYFPRVKGNDLLICPYANGDKFVKSCFNILEPCTNPVEVEILDLIIVPALLVDKQGYRLGYGGGYYDRLLARFKGNIKTLCAVPEELIVNSLPKDEFDIPIDFIIST